MHTSSWLHGVLFDFLYSTFEAIKAKVLRKERDVIQDGFPGFQQNVFVYTVKIFKDYKVSTFYM